MNRRKTFVDAGVLIAAARGRDDIASEAMKILDDPDREFIASPFLRLEVLPKPIYEKRQAEVDFYNVFFQAVTHWADSVEEVTRIAEDEARKYGLGAMDALHVAAAVFKGADDLVTIEKKGKPLHRVKSLRVISIQDTD